MANRLFPKPKIRPGPLDRAANLTYSCERPPPHTRPLIGTPLMVRKRTVRKGAQVVEFAVLLPFLAFMFVIEAFLGGITLSSTSVMPMSY